MERIPALEARQNFGDVVNLAANAKQRFLIHEKGRDRAAIIPLEDLALLEGLSGNGVAVVRLTLGEIAFHLSEDLALVADREERMIVCQNGEEVAALVPSRDLALLESLDQRLDIEAAQQLLDVNDVGEEP